MISRFSSVYTFTMVTSLSLLAAATMTVSGCASTQTMQSSSSIPASTGTVKVTEGPNGNTALSIKVKHLAPPGNLVPGASTYVVWIQPQDAAPQSVGALILNEDLTGQLDTVTSHRRFRLFVTPEASAQGNEPTNDPVFSHYVERTS